MQNSWWDDIVSRHTNGAQDAPIAVPAVVSQADSPSAFEDIGADEANDGDGGASGQQSQGLLPTITGLWIQSLDLGNDHRITGRAEGNYFVAHVQWTQDVGQVIRPDDFNITTNITGVTADNITPDRGGGSEQFVIFTLDTSSLTSPQNGTLTFQVVAGAVPASAGRSASRAASATFNIRAMLPGVMAVSHRGRIRQGTFEYEIVFDKNVHLPNVRDVRTREFADWNYTSHNETDNRFTDPGEFWGSPRVSYRSVDTIQRQNIIVFSGNVPSSLQQKRARMWIALLAGNIGELRLHDDTMHDRNFRVPIEGHDTLEYYPLAGRAHGYFPTIGNPLSPTGTRLSSDRDGITHARAIRTLSFILPITWPSGDATTQAVNDFTVEDIITRSYISPRVVGSLETPISTTVTSLTRQGTTSTWHALITADPLVRERTAEVTVEVRAGALGSSCLASRDVSDRVSRGFYIQSGSAPAGYLPTFGAALAADGTALPTANDGDTGQPIQGRIDFVIPITWPTGDATTQAATHFAAMDITGSSDITGVSVNIRSLTRQGTTSVWRALMRATGATSGGTGNVTIQVNAGALPATTNRQQSQVATRSYAFRAQGPAPTATINPGGVSAGKISFSIQWNVAVTGFAASEVTLSSSGNTFTFSNASMNTGDNARFNYTADVSGYGNSTITATIAAGAIAANNARFASARTSGTVGTFTIRQAGYTPTLAAQALAADGSALPANADGESNTQSIKRRTQFIVPVSWTEAAAQTAAASQFCPNDMSITTELTNVSATVTSITRQQTTAVWHAVVSVSRVSIGGGSGYFDVTVRQGALTQTQTRQGSAQAMRRYFAQVQRQAVTPTLSAARPTDASSEVSTITTAVFWINIDWNLNDPGITTTTFTAVDLTWTAPSGMSASTTLLERRTTLRHDQWKAQVTVTGTGSGTLTGSICGGSVIAVSDSVEANLSGSNTYSVNLPHVTPIVTIGDAENPVGTDLTTIAQNFFVDLTWSIDVGSEFTDADISIANTMGDSTVSASLGALSNVGSTGTNTHYRTLVTVTGNGTAVLTLTVRSGAIPSATQQNASAETSKAFNFSRELAGLTPSIEDTWRRTSIGTTETGTIKRTLVFYTWIDFSEPVTGFDSADASITVQSTLSGVTGSVALANRIGGMPAPVANQNYIAAITLQSTRTTTCTGTVTLDIAAGAVPSGGGRQPSLGASETFTVQIQEPAAEISVGMPTVTGGMVSFPITFDKNIPASEFTAGDVAITASNVNITVGAVTLVRTTSGGDTTGWDASAPISGDGATTFTATVSASAIPETDERHASAQASNTSSQFNIAAQRSTTLPSVMNWDVPDDTITDDTGNIEVLVTFDRNVEKLDGTALDNSVFRIEGLSGIEDMDITVTPIDGDTSDADALYLRVYGLPTSTVANDTAFTFRVVTTRCPFQHLLDSDSISVSAGTVTNFCNTRRGREYSVTVTTPATGTGTLTITAVAGADKFSTLSANLELGSVAYGSS